eukprot:1490827-Rhodomonas_salina.2
MCLSRKHTRWATLLEIGYPLRPPRFGEEDVHLPESTMQYLRLRGPLTPSELIPTGQPLRYARWLRAAVHPFDRKRKRLMHRVIEQDKLDDPDVIADHTLLLQHHVERFKAARKQATSTLIPAPSVIWGRSRRAGIDVRSHSYLDGTPDRLQTDLVEVQSQSQRYYETYSNFTVTIYQGIARIEDDLGGWDLDGMRLHQITRRHPTISSRELRESREDMLRSEKKGYRTLSWKLMGYLTAMFSLSVSLGEPDFGVYPTLSTLESPRELSPRMGNACHWLYLDAVPALSMIGWCRHLVRCGGGMIASVSTRNRPQEVTDFLTSHATAYGSTSARELLRVKNWWTTGDTKTVATAKTLHLWLLAPTQRVDLLPDVLRWIQLGMQHTPPSLGVGGSAWLYWSGSEAGRLGMYDGSKDLLATDGSAANAELGSGYTLRSGGLITNWHGHVEGADEQITSFRPEAAALLMGVRRSDADNELDALVDNESLLSVIAAWIGTAHQPSPADISDADLVLPLIRSIGLRKQRTRFWKLKSHRGEPYNTRADWYADRGTTNTETHVGRTGNRRIIFRTKGYSGVWNRQLSRILEANVAQIFLDRLRGGVLDTFLSLEGMGRQYLGNWWSRRSQHNDATIRSVIQSLTDTYASPANLHRWRRASGPQCPECWYIWGSMAHIQSRCKATKPARILAHNQCRQLVTDCIRKHAKGWRTFPETTFGDTLSTIQRLTGIAVPDMPTVMFADPKLGETRELTWSEAKNMRIDELALQTRGKKLFYNEMTRGWDAKSDFH